MKDTPEAARSTTGRASRGFTDEVRAAMRERADVQDEVRDARLQRQGEPRAMWPTSLALTELTADDESRIGVLLKKAVG